MSTPDKTVDKDEPDAVENMISVEGPSHTETMSLEDVTTTTQPASEAALLLVERMTHSIRPPEEDANTAAEISMPSMASTTSNRSPEELLAKLRAHMVMLSDSVDSASAPFQDREAPISALPIGSSGRSRVDGQTYSLVDAAKRSIENLIGLVDEVKETFSTLDAFGSVFSDPVVQQTSFNRRSSDPSTVPPSSAGPSSSVHQEIPDEEVPINNLRNFHSNALSVTKKPPMISMRRSFQTDELSITLALRDCQQHLATIPDNHITYPFVLAMMCALMFYLYEITWTHELLRDGLLMSMGAWSKWSDLPMGEYTTVTTSAVVHRAWAWGLRLLAQREGDVDFIETALEFLKTLWDAYKEMSLEILPTLENNARTMREELAMCLLEHYRLSGRREHLDESIEHFKAVGDPLGTADIAAAEEPVKSNLGMAYLFRYRHCGNIEDLDFALQLGQTTSFVSKLSPFNNDDAARSYLFAMALVERFEMTSETLDLEKAIQHCQNAILRIHSSHPLLPQYRSSLALLLYSRYEAHRLNEDLQAALEAINVAVSEDRTNRPGSHTYVPIKAIQGYLLCANGESKGDLDAIKDGIRLISKARRDYCGPLYLESHIENYLSKVFLHLFSVSKDAEALLTATHHASLAFDKALDNSPHRFKYGLDLGSLLLQQYHSNLSFKCDDALALFCFVSMSSTWPSIRLKAILKWAETAEASADDPQGAHDALAMALDIIPSLASLEHRMSIQHKILSSQNSAIPNRAAAYAIDEGK